MRIFLDANILFSAAKSDGAMRKLLVACRQSGHCLVADAFVIEEARRNLALKSPAFTEDLESLITSCEIAPVQASSRLDDSVNLVPKDRPVLSAAISSSCDTLLTGDAAHFGHLYGRQIQDVFILRPRDLAERLLAES